MGFEQLVNDLGHLDIHRRIAAAEQIAKLDDTAQYAVALIEALAGDNEDLCQWVTSALESIESPPANQLVDFVAIIEAYRKDDSKSDSAYWAATMLGLLGPAATSAIETLDQTVHSAPHPHVQRRAQWALARIRDAA